MTEGIPKEACGTCRFWLRTEFFPVEHGVCRRRAPTPNEGGVKWVTTHEVDWCGEFEAMVPAAPPTGATVSYPLNATPCDHEWGGFNDSAGMRCLKCGTRPAFINSPTVSVVDLASGGPQGGKE